ncbi:MAG: hypothetical protein IPK78_10815 [Rhodospirillales bacterium]|nr:hypothetical protein [Rhodospirillales bacterium]
MGLHRLLRPRRGRENEGEDRVRVEGHRCDKGAHVVGRGQNGFARRRCRDAWMDRDRQTSS